AIPRQVLRDPVLREMTRPHPRSVEERAARAAGAVHDRFSQRQDLLGIVRILLTRVVHQPAPAVANADDFEAVTEGADRDGADGGIEAGDVATPGEDADGTFTHSAEEHSGGSHENRFPAGCGSRAPGRESAAAT